MFSAQPHITTTLRFTDSDVTVVKINIKEHKIISIYQHPLPPGSIHKGEVNNPAAVVDVIRAGLTQTHSLNQEIIIGLPEDRILFGTGDSQNIPLEKLAEAMKWQAEEQFPGGTDSFYIDWQIILAPNIPSKTLLIAAPKRTVDGFMAVIRQLAKPIACEPTSTSLAKLTPTGETALVAEIRTSASTIILVDSHKMIHFSTIVTDPNQLTVEMQRLCAYSEQKYQTNPSKIYLCGEGATAQWLAFITREVKIPAFALPLPPLANLPQLPLRFAVALSLGVSPPLAPSSPQTINLLPRQLEDEYSRQLEKKQLSFGFKASIIATVITAIIMGLTYINIRLTLAGIRQKIAAQEQAVQATSYDQAAKQAEAANALARQLQRLPAQDKLSAIIDSLYQALPAGVSVKDYTVNLSEKVVIVSGIAPTRDLLLTLKSNLEATPEFNLVTIPLPTLEQKKDVEFSIAIDIASK